MDKSIDTNLNERDEHERMNCKEREGKTAASTNTAVPTRYTQGLETINIIFILI